MTKLNLSVWSRCLSCLLLISVLLLLRDNSPARAASAPTIFFEEAKLFPPTGHPLNGVGRAVDIKGNRAIVGAIGSGSGNGPFDAAFIFERDANGWNYVEELIPSTVQAVTSTFGISVAINGGTALVAPTSTESKYGSLELFTYSKRALLVSRNCKRFIIRT